MQHSGDDDALSWGDADPTLDAGEPGSAPKRGPAAKPVSRPVAPAASPKQVARAAAATPRTPANAAGTDQTGDEDEPVAAPLGNVALVTLGVLGGVYLLYAIGWFVSGSRFQLYAMATLEPVGYLAAWALAVAAAPLWFATVLGFGARRPLWVRILLLLAGVVVLVPWPFLMSGVSA